MRLLFVMILIISYTHLCNAANLPTDNAEPVVIELKNTAEPNTTPTTNLTPTPLPHVYKWVDDKGLTHYGDEPPSKEMAPINLPDLQILKNTDSEKMNTSATTSAPTQSANVPNYRLSISAPKKNETVMQNKDGTVVITLSINTPLLENHHISLNVDSNDISTDDTGTINLPLDVGDHLVQAFIMDEEQNLLADSDTVTFTVIANNPTVIIQPVRTVILPRAPAVLPVVLPTAVPTNVPANASVTEPPSPTPTAKPTKAPKPTKEPKVTPKPVPYISG